MSDNELTTPNKDENISKEPSLQNVESKGEGLLRGIIETLVYMLISFIIIIAIRAFVVQHVRVDGTSMNPTLQDGEHLLIEKLSYRFGEVKRFDIIVFRPYEKSKDVYYVKRVIGLPGEEVSIVDNTIYIDGNPLEEDYGGDLLTEAKDLTNPVKLGEGEYFVLGDNREISKDSRDMNVGTVDEDSIVGKAWYVIYPMYKVGVVEHE